MCFQSLDMGPCHHFYGKLSECLPGSSLDKRTCFTPYHVGKKKKAQLSGLGMKLGLVMSSGGERDTQQGQSHLGNGPGTAAPGVQHDRILMSFLQHLILKWKNSLSREEPDGCYQASKAPRSSLLMEWSMDPQHGHHLGTLLEMQNLRPLPGPTQ